MHYALGFHGSFVACDIHVNDLGRIHAAQNVFVFHLRLTKRTLIKWKTQTKLACKEEHLRSPGLCNITQFLDNSLKQFPLFPRTVFTKDNFPPGQVFPRQFQIFWWGSCWRGNCQGWEGYWIDFGRNFRRCDWDLRCLVMLSHKVWKLLLCRKNEFSKNSHYSVLLSAVPNSVCILSRWVNKNKENYGLKPGTT